MTITKQQFLKTARPLAKSLLKYAMNEGKKYGITDARISIGSSSSAENSVESGVVSESVGGESHSVSVTLFAGDRVLSFNQNSLDGKRLKETMLENMQVIHLVPETPGKGLLDADRVYKGPQTDFDQFDDNPPSQAELIDYARKAEAAAIQTPGIKATRSAGIEAHVNHRLIMASNGLDIYDNSSLYRASVQAVAEGKNGMEIDYDYSVARHFNDMAKPEEMGKKAAENAISKLDSTLPETGEMPIVLSPQAAQSFFNAVMQSIDGTTIYRGASFMKGKVGKQVLSKGITIVDDPHIKRGFGSQSSDTAGVKSDKITFIDDGVLTGYNVNLMEARQLGVDPIGREGGLTNTYIKPGDKTPEELISDIKDGVYITGFNGGTVDVNTGNHSRQATGFLIKDGKITDTAVSGFTVSGNLKDMFMELAVANDTPKMPNNRTSFATPTTRINKVMIGGRKAKAQANP